jgi:hypothetical protein
MAGFNVEGQWDAQQTNGFMVHFDIGPRRPDGAFAATANHSNDTVRGAGFGMVDQHQFTVTLKWSNNTEGVYTAAFDDQGVLRGATFDKKNPAVFAGWHSLVTFPRM